MMNSPAKMSFEKGVLNGHGIGQGVRCYHEAHKALMD